MKKKRLAAAMLAGSLVLSLAGCGGTSGGHLEKWTKYDSGSPAKIGNCSIYICAAENIIGCNS